MQLKYIKYHANLQPFIFCIWQSMAVIIKSTTKKNGNDKWIFGHIVEIGGGLHYPSSAIKLLSSGSSPDS